MREIDMYKHILVAVDGSETSDAALRNATGLARALGSQLRIVYVTEELPLSLDFPATLGDEWRKTIAREGRAVLDRAESAARKAAVSPETRLLESVRSHDRVADFVVAEAEAWPADLIVIGTHGRRGLARLILGSVAEGVARTASMPVLLVRDQAIKVEHTRLIDLPLFPD
jgi:nucleotide-binding universal stress UspA family protein